MAKGSILLIDDERPLHNVFIGMLNLEGYNTRAADGVSQGFRLIGEERPDVIFCDLMMSELSGLDFLRRRNETSILQDVPVIMITAYGMEDLIDEAMALGAFDVLPKPFSRHALIEVLENALAAAGR